MKMLILLLFHRIGTVLRERWYLQLECLALRHQVEVLKRSAKRPRFDPADRCLWVLLSQWWPEWPEALEILQADTVRRWRRQGIWHHLKWRRRQKRPGRPPIRAETRDLIRAMSRDNVLWGAPRIHGELAKLGIKVSRTSVAKYMTRRRFPPSPTWRTFIRNQPPDLVVAEMYAELSSRVRAVSTQVVQAFQWCLRGVVSSRIRRFRCHHAQPATEQNALVFIPTAWAWGSAAPVIVSERSPQELRRPFPNQLFHAGPPIEMGRTDLRLDSSVMNSPVVSPRLSLSLQADDKGQSTDVSQQAAA